ncbi:hypothetical protein GSI_09987 [Ganoderma sinense ZZ0214-1]|uniref:Uncharacterized protein n=1 Tax=Ganoderma sinense ZZ0214-1 TaxID=1077348 RepID=A0A2G8S277_9APHY|nr:hypothetical protein GSI_09987 [Ganoderma sinense ZZ0214-1]
MSVSKLTFIPFTPDDTDSTPYAYHSDRDLFRGEIRGGLNTKFALAARIVDMCLPYSKERYARIVVWCLHLLLDGWPAHIPFMNLSDIKGGIEPLRLLRDLLLDGTLRFIPAPPDVRQRALHDPESVLPHVLSAAKLPPLPPLPRTISILRFSESRFSDLIAPRGQVAPLKRRQPVSTTAHVPPAPVPTPAEERVLHPDTLELVLAAPLGPESSRTPRKRSQRCDVNKARHRPVSNPDSKPMRARKVGALTSNFVLDRPTRPSAPQSKPMKPLSELRLPVMVNDRLGGYNTPSRDDGEEDEIESFSDSEDESERRIRAKRRRLW